MSIPLDSSKSKFIWWPQAELLRRAAPDLVVGLLGVPLALAFAELSGVMISLPSQARLSFLAVMKYLWLFFYLAGLYLLISHSLLEAVCHSHNWSRKERWVRSGFLVLAVALVGLLGIHDLNCSLARKLVLWPWMVVSMPLGFDFWRGLDVISHKPITLVGWGGTFVVGLFVLFTLNLL